MQINLWHKNISVPTIIIQPQCQMSYLCYVLPTILHIEYTDKYHIQRNMFYIHINKSEQCNI